VKKVAKYVAFAVGGFMLIIVWMDHQKLITINWKNWQFSGKMNLSKIIRILSVTSVGFGFGFWLGIRRDILKLKRELTI